MRIFFCNGKQFRQVLVLTSIFCLLGMQIFQARVKCLASKTKIKTEVRKRVFFHINSCFIVFILTVALTKIQSVCLEKIH